MIIRDDFITIKIGGLTFKSRNDSPATMDRFILDPNAISGWYDGVSVKRVQTVRPNSWGDFPEPGLRNSRLITITGTAVAGSSGDTGRESSTIRLHRMRDAFMSLFEDGGYGEMSLQNKSGTRYANVTLEGSPNWIQQIDNVASWKLDLYAPDPRIYGEEKSLTLNSSTSAAGGLTYPLSYPLNFHTDDADQLKVVTNLGNTNSWPKFKVTGNLPAGFVISDNRNNTVRYDGPVSQFGPVVIDMGEGTAIQGGVDNSVLLSVRQWFSIGPNQSISPSFEPIITGPAWCDIIYRDTWI